MPMTISGGETAARVQKATAAQAQFVSRLKTPTRLEQFNAPVLSKQRYNN